MLIHQYDNHTGHYLSSRLADADPCNPGRWLIPAFSTPDPLPERTALTWPMYHDGGWTFVPDHRARMLYRQDNGDATEILIIGPTPAEHDLTDLPRPSEDYTWHDGAWVINPAVIAHKVRAAAMAEFDIRMLLAKNKNAGKADAYAAGLLSNEEIYTFRQWSTYQLALVRVIEQEAFPEVTLWPEQPASYEPVRAATMAVFETRMAIADAQIADKTAAYADGALTVAEIDAYTAWKTYQHALRRAIQQDSFPDAVIWPNAPLPMSDANHA